MIAVSPLDDLARRLVELVPADFRDARDRLGAPAREAIDRLGESSREARERFLESSREAREELSANFKDTLRSGLRRLDLVTREEFDVQRCVLLRTREMVEALEHRVAELEAQLAGKAAPH